MNDSWPATRAALARLKQIWYEADEETRHDIGCWAFGLFAMAVAIIDQFGWSGLCFCLGFIIWRSSRISAS